jgi:hypothetical protein
MKIQFHFILYLSQKFIMKYNKIYIKNLKHKNLPKSKLGVVLVDILWCIAGACQSIHGSYDA